jgi:N-dimethylarginine dimethylaminohydrolase
MYHITIRPDTFGIDEKFANQNPYLSANISKVNRKLAMEQHRCVVKHLTRNVNYVVEKTSECIPDIVFIANGGLSLPRLPEPVMVLPWMKFEQRRNELKYLKEIYDDLNIKTIEFPGSLHAPYEGVAESKWFNNGELLVMGYGYRSSKETVQKMRTLLNEIYTSYGIQPPYVISFHLQSFHYYHLDIAMLAISESECIIHKDAIKPKDLARLKLYLGSVHTLDCDDKFCLNAIIDGENIITHKLVHKETKDTLEAITGKSVIECDVSEFEKAGGGVRCMVIDVYDPRLIKRKRGGSSCSSPSASSPK